jgi:hypothetical protein
VADVGNNRAKPRESVLYVLEEPALRPDKAPEDLTIPVAWQLTFRYVDGPRDCEAMAVDVASNRVFLLTKRTVPAVLYTLPLRPDGKGHLVAHPSVEFTHLRQPTAMDLAPDGRGALVVTYEGAYFFARHHDETWEKAFARKPKAIPLPQRRSGESGCFTADGKAIIVGSEGWRLTLWLVSFPNTQKN